MKEKSSTDNKLISRNWVLKRKRGRVQCNETASSSKGDKAARESEENTSLAKTRFRSEVTTEEPSSKKKGNDGYYYECELCDLGGNLLCCDSCPRTYHTVCLDPPLKRIPTGKWHCPKCCKKTDTYEPMSHLDTVARRARTKLVTKKRPSEGNSDKSEKKLESHLDTVARRARTKLIIKKRPSKGIGVKLEKKLDSSQINVSCSKKPTQSFLGDPMEGSSSFAWADGTGRNNVSPADPSIDRGLSSPTKGMPSCSGLTKPEPDESSEGKPTCAENSLGSRLIESCDDGANIGRKRKIDFDFKDRRKKHKKKKGKSEARNSKKHINKKNTATCEGEKQLKNQKALDQEESLSVEDSAKKSSNTSRKNKNNLGRVKLLEKNSKMEEAHIVEIPTCEDSSTGEFGQVHRVLGCRMRGDSTNSSTTDTNDQSFNEILKSENDKRLSEKNPICDNDVDVGPVNSSPLNMQNLTNGLEGKEESNIQLNETHVFKRSMPKDAKGESEVNLSTEANKNSGSTALIEENYYVSAGAERKERCKREKILAHEKTDVNLSHDVIGAQKAYEQHDSPGQEATDADKELGVGSSFANKVQEPPSEIEPAVKDKIQYEFLVKWVGKSHIHNSWISESQLKMLAKRKLENYKAKYGTDIIIICEERWKQPQRVLSLRTLKDGSKEALIKWNGLSYDECTWEAVDEPVVKKSSHLIDLHHQFERQTLEKNAAKNLGKSDRQRSEIGTLTEQPKELKGGSLFPHQLEALNWLRKCWYRSKNVILADEMGLGKTVSACAFISSLYCEFKAVLPCLVLVPLSTMPNWLSEFASWAPDLNVVEYHGCAKARAIIRQYEWHATDSYKLHKKSSSYKFNVLLTTYEMILADSSHLRGVPWEVLVVDEGHRLKNSESKLFSLLNTFSFQHRVLLTGTPLQNNIGEMYNLLNFLQPSSFPSLSSFEEKFKDLATAEKVDELKKLVAPHMLRRLKKDAMQNIPPKTERMVPVELSSIQAEYYRAMLTKNYQILRNIGRGVAQQSMLNIVMQLRKVCNHPYLIPGTEPESGSVEFLHDMRIKASAKLTLLHSMLKLLYKDGHRVLIFSQMTKLLDILEDYLSIEFGPRTYERVDGSVSVADRQAAIARFNQDKTRFVFLLSTRACGLGINLATADTVIIYDSDFNPHADIQAMNRAHRIGQSNRLLVYRLVVRASVEERILQLAKKKLMLDQLFVNKSGSQKEVEDILRWGTEELFRDASSTHGKDTADNSSKSDEATFESPHKHRKRSGGLGDVYQDKCTEGGNRIVWDENAIQRLLDRSNLQSNYVDNAEGELENDMLGSVKSFEWNDEPTEEQGGAESPCVATDGPCADNARRKDENAVTSSDDNEWDKLLRVRWERYQSEEEATLGRGKRQKKSVSYKEAYASNPNETFTESGGEDEREPETGPEREYTPAGRARKEKYAKLRARQKERIARRNSVAEWHMVEREHRPESDQQLLTIHRGHEANSLIRSPREKSLGIELESNGSIQVEDPLRSKNESASRKVRLAKQQKLNSHTDHPTNFVGQAASAHFRSSNSTPNNLLPVLGLCAPNATQIQSSRKNFKRSVEAQSRSGTRPEFPFNLPPPRSSMSTELKGAETTRKLKLPESSSAVQHQLQPKSSPDNTHPMHPYAPDSPQGFNTSENAVTKTSDFRDKMALHNFPFDEKFLPKFPVPRSMSGPHYDFLPTIPFGSRKEAGSGSMQDIPTVPLLPKLKFPSLDTGHIHNHHGWEVHPTLGSGQMPSPFSSMPENHIKVLENIMMRTGSGSSNLFKGKRKVDAWSEDELDSLWIGVRRHGRGNWVSMLRDPRLRFSKYRSAEDLAATWKEEELKLLEVPKPAKSAKVSKSSAFFGVSNGMMERALHGSRLPSKFHSHLTDMKLGFGDMPSSMPHFETGQFGLQNDLFAPVPSWDIEKQCSSFAGEFSGAPSERQGTHLNIPIEKPILPRSVGPLDLSFLGASCSSSLYAQQKNDDLNRYRKLPDILGRSVNIVPSSRTNITGESTSSVLPENSIEANAFNSKEAVSGGTSSKDKLPHWLREAVSTSTKSTDPELPPTVSAVAQSVRLLYGEENPTIPPFEIPDPPPPQPKDPRQSLKKKRKCKPHSSSFQSFQSRTRNDNDNDASSSVTMAPLFLLHPESMQGTSRRTWSEASLNLPPVSSSSISALPNLPKISNHGLSPSPEVLQLVANCVAPGPLMASISSSSNSSFPKCRLPAQKSMDRAGYQDQLCNSEHKKARESLSHQEQVQGEKEEKLNSEILSKTKSDPSSNNQPKISSHGLPPSPKVQQLVTDCVAPGSHMESISGSSNSSYPENRLPTQNFMDRAGYQDQLCDSEHYKARESSSHLEQGHKEKEEKLQSENSSKTESDPLLNNLPKKSSHGLSSSPAEPQLVTDCVAPGPHMASVSESSNSSFHECKLPAQKSLDKTGNQDQLCTSEQRKASESTPHQEQGFEEREEKLVECSKTEADPSPNNQPDVAVVSSEETMSDHTVSDSEP